MGGNGYSAPDTTPELHTDYDYISTDGGETYQKAGGYYFSYDGNEYYSDTKPSKGVVGTQGTTVVDQNIVDLIGRDAYDAQYGDETKTTDIVDWDKSTWTEYDPTKIEYRSSDAQRSFVAQENALSLQEEYQNAQLSLLEDRLALEREQYETELAALEEEKAELAADEAEAEERQQRRLALAAKGRGGTVANAGGQAGLGSGAPTMKQKLGA